MPALVIAAVAFLLQATAAVRVVTDPPGAEVWIGATRAGVSPEDGLVVAGLPEGPVEITVRLAGHGEVVRSLTLAATGGEPRTVRIQLKPLEEPRKRKGSKGGKVALVAGGVAAAAGIGLALAGGTDPLEVDDDGDGMSERQGDCNDADRDVNPSGAFSIDVTTFAEGAGHCSTPLVPIEVRATNLGCQTVQVFSVMLSDEVVGGNCGGGAQTIDLPVLARLVGAGMRGHVISAHHFGGTRGCCRGGVCAGDASCDLVAEYAVQTTAGQRFARFPYAIAFTRGPTCPACPSGASPPFVRSAESGR